MTNVDLTRRGFLGGTAASALIASGVMPAHAATTVGFIYVGPRDDWGWNQAPTWSRPRCACWTWASR